MLYFAYGSNMCAGRLVRRVPSAREVGVARLSNHALRFHGYIAQIEAVPAVEDPDGDRDAANRRIVS